MSRRWTISDDIFLAHYHEVGANFVASHDLHFTGKNAGENRMKKLKESGVWDKIAAYTKAHREMNRAWIEKFSPNKDSEIIDALYEGEGMNIDEPWVSSEEKGKQDAQKTRVMFIPEDVKEQARQAWNKIMNNSYRDGPALIAQAILTERENCASVAEGFDAYAYAHEVAQALRKRH